MPTLAAEQPQVAEGLAPNTTKVYQLTEGERASFDAADPAERNSITAAWAAVAHFDWATMKFFPEDPLKFWAVPNA